MPMEMLLLCCKISLEHCYHGKNEASSNFFTALYMFDFNYSKILLLTNLNLTI